jgi:hypothetical protein
MKNKGLTPHLILSVNGSEWKVFVLPPLKMTKLLETKQGSTPLGACHYLHHRIYIRGDLSPSIALTTLGHELIHASFEATMGSIEARSESINMEIACDLASGVTKVFMQESKKINDFIKKHFKEMPFDIEEDDEEDDIIWLGKN